MCIGLWGIFPLRRSFMSFFKLFTIAFIESSVELYACSVIPSETSAITLPSPILENLIISGLALLLAMGPRLRCRVPISYILLRSFGRSTNFNHQYSLHSRKNVALENLQRDRSPLVS